MGEEDRVDTLSTARGLLWGGGIVLAIGAFWGLMGYFFDSYIDFIAFVMIAGGGGSATVGGLIALKLATDG
ncbi:MAG: hypothetical protein K0S37_4338 [Microbacterium sp.]|nr:hypothetical protein [Microbacterium sp.]